MPPVDEILPIILDSGDGCYWWFVINFLHFPAALFSYLTATQICKEKGARHHSTNNRPPSTCTQENHFPAGQKQE